MSETTTSQLTEYLESNIKQYWGDGSRVIIFADGSGEIKRRKTAAEAEAAGERIESASEVIVYTFDSLDELHSIITKGIKHE